MRFSSLYVESVDKWTVVDTLYDGYILKFFDTERDAYFAAKFEEYRWTRILVDAAPVAIAS
ncbi:MAG: hypothetical protein O3A85_04395 [Proteobacteria bacterium]|nr:hypothetical protein [Pseudomonadota bacterium]